MKNANSCVVLGKVYTWKSNSDLSKRLGKCHSYVYPEKKKRERIRNVYRTK